MEKQHIASGAFADDRSLTVLTKARSQLGACPGSDISASLGQPVLYLSTSADTATDLQ